MKMQNTGNYNAIYNTYTIYIHTGPDLGKKLDEAGISAAKRPGGVGGEAGGKFRWGEAPSR